MASDELTPWFIASKYLPVRPGVYEVMNDLGELVYSRWTGKF